MARWHIRNSPHGRGQNAPRPLTCARKQGSYPHKPRKQELTSKGESDRNGQEEPEVYEQREGGSLDMRTFLRSKALLVLTFGLLLAFAGVAVADRLDADADTLATTTPASNSNTANQAPGTTQT